MFCTCVLGQLLQVGLFNETTTDETYYVLQKLIIACGILIALQFHSKCVHYTVALVLLLLSRINRAENS